MNRYAFAALFIFALECFPSFAADGMASKVPVVAGRMICSTQWTIGSEPEPLLIVITASADELAPTHKLVTFRKSGQEWHEIASFEVDASPLDLILTSEQDGALISEWVTGSGYLAYVLEYSPGERRPRIVLRTGAKAPPDLVRSPTAEFDFALLVRDDHAGVAARGTKGDTASVYEFKKGGEVQKRTVAWSDRFAGFAGGPTH